MAVKLGMNCKLYYNTGDYTTPVWVEITNAKDVTLNLEASEADVTTRGNAGWRATTAALRDGSVDFEMIWDTADTAFAAIQAAYFANSAVEVAVMDGDITTVGSEGLRASMSVTSFTRNEPLEEAVSVAVGLKPTYAANAPEWMEITT